MIAESDYEVPDDNVFDIDDDDDYIASPDVDSEIEDHVSDTIRKNQTTTIHVIHPRQTELWPESKRREDLGKQRKKRSKGRDRSIGNVQGRGTSQLHHQVNPPQAPGDVRKKRQSSKNTANDRKRCQSLELGMGYTTNLALSHKSTPVI